MNERPLTLTKDGIRRASQMLRDETQPLSVKISDSTRDFHIILNKTRMTIEMLHAKYSEYGGFFNEKTSAFNDLVTKLRSPTTLDCYILIFSSGSDKHARAIITSSVDEINSILFDKIVPLYPILLKDKLGKLTSKSGKK